MRQFVVLVLSLTLLSSQTLAQPVPVAAGGAAAAAFSTSTERPVFTAPNPPSCAQEWADTANDLTRFAVDIIDATAACGLNRGWYGNSPDGNLQTWPFHNGRGCAALIIDAFAKFSSTIGDLEAAAYDCFNDRTQGCGQSIAQTAQCMFEGTTSLVTAVDNCEPPGGNPPYIKTGSDVPVEGFLCWSNIWHWGQRMLKASKYIDVALGTCPTLSSATTPTPMADGSANTSAPTPTADGSTNTAVPTPTADAWTPTSNADPLPPTPAADVPTPTAGGSASSSAASATLGASWSSLQQAEPFKMIGQGETAPAERRLSSVAVIADSGADAERMHQRLNAAKARMDGFLQLFGVDNRTVAEDLREFSEDELEEITLLAGAVYQAFAGARDTTPISV